MVLDAVHVFVALLATWHRAGERFLVRRVDTAAAAGCRMAPVADRNNYNRRVSERARERESCTVAAATLTCCHSA